VSDNVRLFVMIGLCGGYTTFSSFSLQTLELIRGGAMLRAMVNVLASVVLCVAATACGHLIAGHFNGQAQQISQAAIEEDA
jgi:CrcB protein